MNSRKLPIKAIVTFIITALFLCIYINIIGFVFDEEKQPQLPQAVMIQIGYGSGSGIIINKEEILTNTEGEKEFKYSILTNAHVVKNRTIKIDRGIDVFRKLFNISEITLPIQVLVFDEYSNIKSSYEANVERFNDYLDLSLLSIITSDDLYVSKILEKQKIDDLNILDNVLTISCHVGNPPSYTSGIISRKKEELNKQYFVLTSPIALGSSGGGSFVLVDNEYYLFSIISMIGVDSYGRVYPNIAIAINGNHVLDFLEDNE